MRIVEGMPTKERPDKARAIIIDNEQNTIISNYDGCLMFPGGKLDNGETSFEAMQREVHEELGHAVTNADKLFTFQLTAERYPERDGSISYNRLVETDYFLCRTPQIIVGERSLTEKETKGNFQTKIINALELINYIESHKTDNERWPFFKEEIGIVACKISEYLK